MSQASPPSSPQEMPGARAALILLLAINLFNYIDRFILVAVAPKIRLAFLQDDANPQFKIGLLSLAFMIAYMVLAPIFGYLADRGSRWLLISLGVILWSLASGSFGAVDLLRRHHRLLDLADNALFRRRRRSCVWPGGANADLRPVRGACARTGDGHFLCRHSHRRRPRLRPRRPDRSLSRLVVGFLPGCAAGGHPRFALSVHARTGAREDRPCGGPSSSAASSPRVGRRTAQVNDGCHRRCDHGQGTCRLGNAEVDGSSHGPRRLSRSVQDPFVRAVHSGHDCHDVRPGRTFVLDA